MTGLTGRTASQRRRETFDAAIKVHGGSPQQTTPAEIGLIDTVITKCNARLVAEKMVKSKKLMKEVKKGTKKKTKSYEDSEENKIRSVAIYYSRGVMGKRKYRTIYREMCYKRNTISGRLNIPLSVAGCPVPRLLSYDKLMPYIKQIPIGNVFSVYNTFCEDLEPEDKCHGCYRGLEETLLTLAKYYLSDSSSYTLTWFNDEPYTFFVSLGGDGAPCGKDDTACAWLVGLLNITRGVLSSNENYLLFGANCSENSEAVKRYLKHLLAEIDIVQSKTYVLTHKGQSVNVKFRIAELPNDMKMLSFITGELSNSAKYFSSFADVTKETGVLINGTFGKEKNNTWKPWKYEDRLKVARGVEKLKKQLSKDKLAVSTKRNEVTTRIHTPSGACHSGFM